MSTKHTPGPWYVAGYPHPKASQFAFFSHRFVATRPELDGDGTCAVVCSMMDGPEKVANARLIAAAPELLEVLEDLMAIRAKCFIPNNGDRWDRKALAAIAKARGEQ